MSSYCPAALPTSPTNALAPSAYAQSLGALATYSCVAGYSGTPMSACQAYNSTIGLWSAVNDSCTRTNYK